MKRKNFVVLAILIACTCTAIFGVASHFKVFNAGDNLLLENVEALTREDPNTANTGPGKVKNCAGGAGTKKLCMCENIRNCTESPCQ